MTWKEFRDYVDRMLPEDTIIKYIDTTGLYDVKDIFIFINNDNTVEIS